MSISTRDHRRVALKGRVGAPGARRHPVHPGVRHPARIARALHPLHPHRREGMKRVWLWLTSPITVAEIETLGIIWIDLGVAAFLVVASILEPFIGKGVLESVLDLASAALLVGLGIFTDIKCGGPTPEILLFIRGYRPVVSPGSSLCLVGGLALLIISA